MKQVWFQLMPTITTPKSTATSRTLLNQILFPIHFFMTPSLLTPIPQKLMHLTTIFLLYSTKIWLNTIHTQSVHLAFTSSLSKVNESDLDFYNVLVGLDTTKTMGLDGIPLIILSMCASALYKPLHYLFSMCLNSGYLPLNGNLTELLLSTNQVTAVKLRIMSHISSL